MATDSLVAATLAAVNPAGWPVHRIASATGAPPAGPAIVLIHDANDPAFDRIKRGLVEVAVIGGEHPAWIGATEAPPLPAGDNGALVISFYTRATRYEAFAEKLRASLERHGVRHELIGLDVPGSWEMVCAFKAEFIREQWGRTDRPVIWLDADATLEAPLGLLAAPGADFAITKHNGWKFSAGSMLFGRSAAAEALLDQWVLRCRADPMMWDQNHLDAAWADVSAAMPLVTRWLPSGYFAVWDHYDAAKLGPAVVMQHQASRGEFRTGRKSRIVPPQPDALRAARRASRWTRGADSIFRGLTPRGDVAALAGPIRALAADGVPLIDIGCGDGSLARSFAPGSYVGADPHAEAVLAARTTMSEHRWQILMEEYPFPVGSSVLLLDVLGRVPDQARTEIIARATEAAPRLILCDAAMDGWGPPGWDVVQRATLPDGRVATAYERQA